MVTVRRALSREHARPAADLVARAFASAYSGFLTSREIEGLTPDRLLATWIEDNDSELLALVDGDVLVGVARIGSDPADGARGHIFSLYIDPTAQGRGHGRALLAAAESALAERAYSRVSLHVFDGNTRAQALYASAGWAPSGTRVTGGDWSVARIELVKDLELPFPWREELLADLDAWIRIPSIGADPAHADDLMRGAEWTRARLARHWSDVRMEVSDDAAPLVIGGLRASAHPELAPTYCIYGHYDVQPVGEGWSRPAFEPVHADGWIFGRGASDDKGQFLALMKGAELLAQEGRLPVNLILLADGEEETLGTASGAWIAKHREGIDGVILFDSSFLDTETPVINISTRGLVQFEITCRTGDRDLHSGLAGGAAMNALHELVDMLGSILPRDGALDEEFLVGAIPPDAREIEEWRSLTPGASLLAAQGGIPADARADDEYYLRTWARPSLDLHGISPASDVDPRSVVVTHATARGSVRLAPGQRPEIVIAHLERKVRSAETARPGSAWELNVRSQTHPSHIAADTPLIAAGVAAFERVWGRTPKILRAGGTLPFLAALGELGLPYLLTGLHLPEGNAHGPDECILERHLLLGVHMVSTLLTLLPGTPTTRHTP